MAEKDDRARLAELEQLQAKLSASIDGLAAELAAREVAAESESRERASQQKIEGAARRSKMREPVIRQGVKATVETVPMPVRLTADQVRALKVEAALSGVTVSGIIRGCINDHLIEMYDHLPGFADALEAAGVRGLG
ncbi:hypothetical protein [Paraburkholderia heleia]|uniref:hypothetical protein n=1 Tax=Paraburkholderia heleia TaxID=634127 RepID=UPI002AB6618E|nr:hypothetical protein [Paraburkholderia heleia]